MRVFFISLFFLLTLNNVFSQSENRKQYKIICIGFYNLENLFDTIDSPDTHDIEFTPKGVAAWDTERYRHKLENMADVISKIGTEKVPTGAAVLGVSEVENRQVLEDLVKMPKLKERNYKIVHYDSPDFRGIDVALLYQADKFTPVSSRAVRLNIPEKEDFKSRDQLLVSGKLEGEEMHFIVNHWPSRRGGEKRSRPLRNAAADLCRSIADSILQINKDAKIIMMGDLNDDPINQSLTRHLKASGDKKNLKEGHFYNPMYNMFKSGKGTLAYRDTWSLFDQIIFTQGCLGKNYSTYKYYKTSIFNKRFLLQKKGRYAAYPLRSFAGGVYLGGYSDHFPVYSYMIKELN